MRTATNYKKPPLQQSNGEKPMVNEQVVVEETDDTGFDLSRSAVARVVRKNGVDRIGKDAVDAIRAKAEEYIGNLTKSAYAAAQHAKRKVIRAEDIAYVTGGAQ